MFNLETAIAEWRRQMLAAGIKTPVPLDELESHLREEIERQIQSGADSKLAFETAVQKIGSASALKCEFKKVDATRKERARALDRKVIFISLDILIVLVPLVLSSVMLFKAGDLSQIRSGQQMSGLAAVATFAIFAWGGRLGYRLFPVVRSGRSRELIGALVAAPAMVCCFVFYYIILPRHEFTMGPLFVAIIWGFLAPFGVALGWVLGLETAARKKGTKAVS
jgi:hypothetical protein